MISPSRKPHTPLLAALLLLLGCAAAAQSPVRTYAEVANPQGPAYYDPVTVDGAAYTGTLVDRRADDRLAAWKQIVDGRADGEWLEWYPSGTLRYRGTWRAGRQEGEQVYYHPNGLPRERSYLRAGRLDGSQTTYALDGHVVRRCGYLQDVLQDSCLVFGALPPVATDTWPPEDADVDASRVVTEFWPDGRPKLWREVDADGRAHGRWLEWTDNGVLRYRAGWRGGLGDGVWTYYLPDGALRYYGVYRADTLVAVDDELAPPPQTELDDPELNTGDR